MGIKKHIPNSITCGNLFCGCIAIVAALKGDMAGAAIAIAIAAILDFFDGMSARLLKVSSNIGKDLDSLADMVSFGIVPGIMMYKLMEQLNWSELQYNANLVTVLIYFPFIISVFSGIRLAKFNNDSRQTGSFIGLPTPANTLLITSIALIAVNNAHNLGKYIKNPVFIATLSIISAYLLVAELPLLALKFKTFGIKGNELRYLIIIVSIVLFILFFYSAFPIIIGLYILLSVYNNKISPKPQAGQ